MANKLLQQYIFNANQLKRYTTCIKITV